MRTKGLSGLVRCHMDDPLAAETLAISLAEISLGRPVVVVCVGTDRSTGDALGPLVGTQLQEHRWTGFSVYGTLQNPVHALNLEESIARIEKDHSGSLIVAIDACLGRSENVGCISLKAGPLVPGAGVRKSLPSVGDFHIVGIVNVGGLMEYFVLQNTRLSLVMRMGDVIAEGIRLCFSQWRQPLPAEVQESALT